MPSAAEPQPSRNISRKDAKAAKVGEKWQKSSQHYLSVSSELGVLGALARVNFRVRVLRVNGKL
jgi:hypothetical protein